MPVRPPQALAPKNTLPKDPVSAAFDHEVLAEKAGTYGRLLQGLEKALAAHARAPCEETLAAAGEALWYVMIQRELCGFRRHDLFFREFSISPALRLRMGVRPGAGRAKGPRSR